MKQELPIRIRLAVEEDVNFIFSSWLKSYRNSPFSRKISNTIYFNEHHKVLERIMETSEVLIACNQEDTTQIYGYIVAEKIDGIFILHYVYIKHSFRKMGIAKALLNTFDHDFSNAGCYTHNTHIAEKLSGRYNLIFHPYILINYEKEKANDEPKGKTEDQPAA